MPWHPVGPIIVILTAIGVLVAGLADNGPGRTGVLVTLGVMSIGVLYYWFVPRRSAIWAHHEPDEEGPMASSAGVS